MNDYRRVTFTLLPNSETEGDILSALLCDAGYESFEQSDDGIIAYMKDELFSHEAINEALNLYCFNAKITWIEEFVEGRDWNEEWEKNSFTPMLIANRCVIHSPAHKDFPNAQYKIVINPRMSFGTGHHETTNLMIENILQMDIKDKRILDVGTGTGILAILSSMCGASYVTGIEIDAMAYENACENVCLNGVNNIKILHGDASLIDDNMPKVDILFANINRNIILNDIAKYAFALKPGGIMQLSGFYDDDLAMLIDSATQNSLCEVNHKILSHWAIQLLKKTE
ncbi:MAG: 50S ribosomal protein L11 methyltransferase [Muribaculaceae bacterium]